MFLLNLGVRKLVHLSENWCTQLLNIKVYCLISISDFHVFLFTLSSSSFSTNVTIPHYFLRQ